MKNLSSAAKTLDKIFHVLYVLLKVGAIAAMVGIGIIAAYFIFDLAPEQVGTGFDILEIGFVEIRLAEGFSPDESLILIMTAVTMLLALGFLVAGRFGIRYIRNILQPMAKGEPFSSSVSTNLKKLTVLSLVLGAAVNVAALIEQTVWVHAFDVYDLLLSEKITGVTVNYELDLSFLVVTAVLLLLTYVFRYGEELQQLSDETL